MGDILDELQLQELAISFLHAWSSWASRHQEPDAAVSFEQTEICKSLLERGLVAAHPNARVGEYSVHFKYAGPIFVTSRGEIAFVDSEQGRMFAECVADGYRKFMRGGDTQVLKVIAEY